MALPKPGCAGWFASVAPLVLAAVLALAGVATGHSGHDHGASPSPLPPGSIPIAHILVAPFDDPKTAAVTEESAWQAALGEAEGLVAHLSGDPGAFATWALHASDDLVTAMDGGHLGWIRTDGATSTLPASVVEAVRALVDPVPGTIVGPIRSPLGWHVVMIEDPAWVPAAWPASRPVDPAVILVDPGAEPRQVLRFAPPAGSATTVASTVFTITLRSEGVVSPDVGAATFDGAWRVTATPDPASTGTRLDLVLDGVHRLFWDGSEASDEAAAADALAGTEAFVVVAPNGLPVEVGLDLPDGLDPGLVTAVRRSVDAVSEMVGSYPDEPVGVGARWTTVRQVPGAPDAEPTLVSTQTILAGVDDSTVQLTTSTARVISTGMAQEPGVGASVKLAETEQSVGTRTVDLAGLDGRSTIRSTGTAWYAPLGDGSTVVVSSIHNEDVTLGSDVIGGTSPAP